MSVFRQGLKTSKVKLVAIRKQSTDNCSGSQSGNIVVLLAYLLKGNLWCAKLSYLLLVPLEEAIKGGGGLRRRVHLQSWFKSREQIFLGRVPSWGISKVNSQGDSLSLSFPSGLLLLLLLRVLISTLSGGVWSLQDILIPACLLLLCYKNTPPHFHPDFGVIYSQLNTSKTLKWSVLANSKHHKKTPYDWVPLQIKTIVHIRETPNYHLTSVPLFHGC